MERIYWREGQLWVRIRSHDGRCLSVHWQQTDLPRLTPIDFPEAPRLSAQSLLELAQHLQHHRQRSRRPRGKASTG